LDLTAMPPDRLSELQRQRTLVQQQLAWIDAEIAKASAQEAEATGTPPGTPVAVSSASASSIVLPAPLVTDPQEAEAIIARYHRKADTSVDELKRGCIMQFIVAMLVLGALTGLAILAYSLLR
jgi:hypothetical protein